MTLRGIQRLDTSKLAIVYLRQSSPGQVRDHVIATQEQYRLREIPEGLGFPPERILVVDADLGVSGQTIAGRKGMLRVLELLERGEAACVVVRDISRLSRDEFNTDMGLIARQCFLSGAVIVTPEKTYDPGDSSDQLLLGLQGLIAGWDRANIVRRLNHHRRAKQARGVNINGAVPPGYEKIIDVPRSSPEHGKLRITRDTEVRERIALILKRGLELKGVFAVVRFLRSHSLLVPAFRGEEESVSTGVDGKIRAVTKGKRVVRWVEATRDNVTRILKNPTIRWGRRQQPKSRHARPGDRETPMDDPAAIRALHRHPGRPRWVHHLGGAPRTSCRHRPERPGEGVREGSSTPVGAWASSMRRLRSVDGRSVQQPGACLPGPPVQEHSLLLYVLRSAPRREARLLPKSRRPIYRPGCSRARSFRSGGDRSRRSQGCARRSAGAGSRGASPPGRACRGQEPPGTDARGGDRGREKLRGAEPPRSAIRGSPGRGRSSTESSRGTRGGKRTAADAGASPTARGLPGPGAGLGSLHADDPQRDCPGAREDDLDPPGSGWLRARDRLGGGRACSGQGHDRAAPQALPDSRRRPCFI